MSDPTLVDRLAELQHSFPLPAAWAQPELFAEAVDVAGLPIHLVGLSSTSELGMNAFGSAGAAEGYPLERAYFELIERAAVLEALRPRDDEMTVHAPDGSPIRRVAHSDAFPATPDNVGWAYAKSNGVAVGTDWESACRAARAELLERDRVLCAWFGWSKPVPVPLPAEGPLAQLGGDYEIKAFRFPPPPAVEGTRQPSELDDVQVAGVFALPTSSRAPLAHGLSAGVTLEAAQAGATRELLQRLGFLWGEEIPTDEPAFEPTSAYHQEYYLWPGARPGLLAWLQGEHEPLPRRSSEPREAGYLDITPRTVKASLRVVKALPGCEIPLTFGVGHPDLAPGCTPPRVHPIA